ncbi:helix-turn-helix domain-containing protein [Chryseobacterium sp. RLHN22]|uniref:helix-turn-helix domain-containing protein n=1 Tax=Chryseobacterium sp. RLHN22 TaxID=3437885 RepID=UPI003D9B5CF2
MNSRIYVVLLLLVFNTIFSQNENYSEFYKIRSKYEKYAENDQRALPLVNTLITKSKKEQNHYQLARAYQDALFYSSAKANKLRYSDSIIIAALKTKDNDLIGNSYLGKGIVYYFNYRQYQSALDQYLKAYEYLKNAKDPFQKYQNLYHLGVVKSYLGYYDEAEDIFKECIIYFKSKINQNIHENLIFNHRKGYYNSLHQLAVCYRNLKKYEKADSLIDLSLKQIHNSTLYQQEYGYFLKESGISNYRKKKYTLALASLNKSLKPISGVKDFAWGSVDYFYIGKTFLAMNERDKAVSYFQKVDSIFQQNNFILPELRQNYELLIDYYKKEKQPEKELFYTKQLLKADSLLSKDFTYLSTRIHKDYDTKTLQEEKVRLEKRSSWSMLIIAAFGILTVVLIIIVVLRFKSEKNIKEKYQLLEEKLLNNIELSDSSIAIQENTTQEIDNPSNLDKAIIDDILKKLKQFEEKEEFTKGGITLNKLAIKFKTNSNYLSQVINDHKGANFARYLSELRINFITSKLYNDKKYLSYTIETLAEECGIASRTNFSNLFQEINGIRPTDFIKKRNADLSKSE